MDLPASDNGGGAPAAKKTDAAGVDPAADPGLMDFADPPDPAKKPEGADQAAPTAPYYPEGLPDDVKGKDDRETIDKLNRRAKGLRDQLAGKGLAAPESADGYKFEFPEELKGLVDEKSVADAPVFRVLRDVAFKNGLPADKFSAFVTDTMQALHAAGLVKPAETPDQAVQVSGAKEFAEMVKSYGGEDKARKILADEKAYVGNLVSTGVLTPEDGAVMAVDFMGTAAGMRVFQKLRAHFTGHELPASQAEPGAALSLQQVQQRYADPKYTTDPAFRAETEKLHQEALKAAGRAA